MRTITHLKANRLAPPASSLTDSLTESIGHAGPGVFGTFWDAGESPLHWTDCVPLLVSANFQGAARKIRLLVADFRLPAE